MSKQKSSAKALIITDDEQEDPNPFSFREFLRWKSLEPEPDVDLEPEPDLYPDPDLDLDQTHRQNRQLPQNQPGGAVRLSEPAVQNRSLEGVTFDPEVRSCFFSEPSLDPQEEEWGRSLQSGVDSTSSLCTEEEGEEETRFSSRPEAQQGAGAAESYEAAGREPVSEEIHPGAAEELTGRPAQGGAADGGAAAEEASGGAGGAGSGEHGALCGAEPHSDDEASSEGRAVCLQTEVGAAAASGGERRSEGGGVGGRHDDETERSGSV
ncbi:endosome-associated-trafficking regulator 1 isoform X4 [Gymnodraco acuticeps]|uniref:Endosome-associated-trafficking regulator 1 isoform X4 n=1 Tax=Gymnodraco acuticeps TaxID=8218 RepID=A0A6P8VYA3_GYMAC|nr:endosome-associated-trafficking regulator 1 isoform X4 [Gymnodraco acuticeps]XP_034096149.1 endosome-associated-trafficking regulator 1 isoform X4 [Gymnodraco acuticeps]